MFTTKNTKPTKGALRAPANPFVLRDYPRQRRAFVSLVCLVVKQDFAASPPVEVGAVVPLDFPRRRQAPLVLS